MKCIPLAINGMPDHIHILYFQSPGISISQVVKQLKGASSHWLNHEKLKLPYFRWQNGYSVFSVDNKKIDGTVRYIKNQKEHHKSMILDVEMLALRD